MTRSENKKNLVENIEKITYNENPKLIIIMKLINVNWEKKMIFKYEARVLTMLKQKQSLASG